MTSEIVRVEVLDNSSGKLRWIDSVTSAPGWGAGPVWLEPGVEAVVEVETSPDGSKRIVRVLTPEPPPPAEIDEPILVNGQPVRPDDRVEPRLDELRPGDIRTTLVRFTSVRTAERDRGRSAKTRPAVVVEVDGDDVAVRPVHGTNSAARRIGGAVRLRDWKHAGLRKPSVAAREPVWVDRRDVGGLIGSISQADAARLGIEC